MAAQYPRQPARRTELGRGFTASTADLFPSGSLANVVDPTDLATALVAIIAIRDGLIALGLMDAAE